MSASSVSITSENAPSASWSASMMRATEPCDVLWAARCRKSSESDDVLKSVPRAARRSRIARLFERLPLCASARLPSWKWTANGWTLAGLVAEPVVE